MKLSFIRSIYFISLLPLVASSITFFYWFFNRIYAAVDVDIKGVASIILSLYLICCLATIAMVIIFVIRNSKEWKKVLLPLFFIGVTVLSIGMFGAVYDSFKTTVVVKIVNDTEGLQLKRIWSNNFEYDNFDKEKREHIFSYNPVRNYDWEVPELTSSVYRYRYDYSRVFVDLYDSGNNVSTYELPEYKEGYCGEIKLNELVKR